MFLKQISLSFIRKKKKGKQKFLFSALKQEREDLVEIKDSSNKLHSIRGNERKREEEKRKEKNRKETKKRNKKVKWNIEHKRSAQAYSISTISTTGFT